jgi:hypothetical protein
MVGEGTVFSDGIFSVWSEKLKKVVVKKTCIPLSLQQRQELRACVE